MLNPTQCFHIMRQLLSNFCLILIELNKFLNSSVRNPVGFRMQKRACRGICTPLSFVRFFRVITSDSRGIRRQKVMRVRSFIENHFQFARRTSLFPFDCKFNIKSGRQRLGLGMLKRGGCAAVRTGQRRFTNHRLRVIRGRGGRPTGAGRGRGGPGRARGRPGQAGVI